MNRLPSSQVDDSHEMSRLVFSEKKRSSAAVVIGALRVNVNRANSDNTPHSAASD